ncbi:hypothetical protein K504DRAFT_142136 [Pleomassaria siparia CBS 279.74]|uniref:DUF1711-domain-containing protein n=1 Tax=Pleomassaria siparia CBS 279.74 TaxID=1314801 RepID=A0A6G1KL94_9PLEO|nr:hypothetical protein K504DRAFT_142136 [Pleomassaria siparia CBS 279.74]
MSTPKTTKSRTVVLKLSPDHLVKFPHVAPPADSLAKPSPSPETTPAAPVVDDPTPSNNPSNNPSDSAVPVTSVNGTSTPSSSLAPPTTGPGGKRKTPAGPKTGTKRGAAALTPDGAVAPKPRGKPGPKKKQKLGDMINDPNSKAPFASSTPAQKLGPKANQGAINAGLRALDRTGKPCRKWEKKGIQLRSFTGVNWAVPTWRAPKHSAVFAEDVKSDSTGSSDTKVKDESSAVSEKSGAVNGNGNGNGNASTPVPPPVNGVTSSPAPVAVAS